MLMHSLWVPEIPILEKIVRSVVVYLFLLLAFRLSGKRQVAQLTPFDLIVLLIISNVVQNALIGSDNSLAGGLIGAATIIVLNFLIVQLTFRSRKARRLLEAKPTLLIHHGRILQDNLSHELMTLEDLLVALRVNGIDDPRHVKAAVLEENGHVSVIPYPEDETRPTLK
ncbi:MAG TPA: YetF domain-containing protein [bacterium]|nr:YetF domain-containing protein [bacterium]